MKNNNGFSLVELLVSLIVASVLILTVGVLSDIGHTGYRQATQTQFIHSDISYGLKLVQNRVRSSNSLRITDPGVAPWQGRRIQVNNQEEFGLCQANGNTNLVRRPTASTACEDSEVILAVPAAGSLSLALSWPCACAPTACTGSCLTACTAPAVSCACSVGPASTCSSAPSSVKAQVTGEKNNIDFDVATIIGRRR